MNFNEIWDWQGQEYCLEDFSSIEMSKLLFSGRNPSAEEHLSSMFNHETTPVRACGDLAYHDTEKDYSGKEREEIVPSPQAKRRRMLQFESEVLDELLCNDEILLQSQETEESLEETISRMSHWVAGFSEGTLDSSNDGLDPSSEGWIANCFNDAEMLFCSEEDINDTIGASDDVQIDISELCNDSSKQGDNAGKELPVFTHQNVVFKGRNSYIHATPSLASSVVYPFAFIKPCGAHGDTTLKDINERIHNPPKPNPREDPSISYPTSAFSGKPVVGKTKIRTEGGRGSITIMRTKG